MFEYDTGMPPIKWRIAPSKLIFVNRIIAKSVDNIIRKVLIQESIKKIKGLVTECQTLCSSSLMAKEVTKNEIKHAIKTKFRVECIKSSSINRVDLNPDETQ